YLLAIKHALKAPELNQLILTFGLGIALSQTVNLIFTSQSWKLSLGYVSASATVGDLSFGVFDFVYAGVAIVLALGLKVLLTRSRFGKAALAMGLIGAVGSVFLTKQAIFPLVGG